MISEKIKLLESFKQNQFSKLIEKINSKILATLKSGHFNPRLAPYLEKMNKDGVPFTDFDLDLKIFLKSRNSLTPFTMPV